MMALYGYKTYFEVRKSKNMELSQSASKKTEKHKIYEKTSKSIK